MLGIVSTNIYSYYASAQNELQLPEGNEGGYEFSKEFNILSALKQDVTEKPSPKDRIKEDQIRVGNENIIITLKGAEWASFTDTNSMDPIIDSEAHAIEIIPENEEEIQVGDIAVYESEYAEGSIIHRIVQKGKDEKGTYFIMKGDNNPTNDPGKIRFSQIKRVVVAIIY
jgi:hypothetical protein